MTLDARDWAWVVVVLSAMVVIAGSVCVLVGFVIQRDTHEGTDNVINQRRKRNGGRMIVTGALVAFAAAFGLIAALLLTVRPI
jgi:hypothetical protein